MAKAIPGINATNKPQLISGTQNFHEVNLNLKVLISDDDLSTISQLKIHSILQEAFEKFKIVDYKVDSSETFYRKFIYLDLSGLCYVYEKDDKLFEKIDRETIFKEAYILKIGEEEFIKTLSGIFKLFEFNEENYLKLNYLKLKQIDDNNKNAYWTVGENFHNFSKIKPLTD